MAKISPTMKNPASSLNEQFFFLVLLKNGDPEGETFIVRPSLGG